MRQLVRDFGCGWRRRAGDRQPDGKRRSLIELGRHVDRTADVCDDSVDQRQTEARTRSNALGREERIEHAIEHLGIDAGAGVTHRQAYMRTGYQFAMEHRTALANVHPLEPHFEHAAGRHRLHGVRAQVHHHLMKLRRIGDHRGVTGVELPRKLYAPR